VSVQGRVWNTQVLPRAGSKHETVVMNGGGESDGTCPEITSTGWLALDPNCTTFFDVTAEKKEKRLAAPAHREFAGGA